jgi:hypothetical protein
MGVINETSESQSSVNPLEYWKEHIENMEKSGLSQAEYCRRHNLKESQIRYKKKKIMKSSLPSAIKLIQLGGEVNFNPGASVVSKMRFWLGDYCIEVCNNFSSELLVQLIRTLRSI